MSELWRYSVLASEKLQVIADDIASDIEGDFPGTDVNYDLYVEEIGGKLMGVINMGDAWSGVYLWEDNDWTLTSGDPYEVTMRIIAKRSNP